MRVTRFLPGLLFSVQTFVTFANAAELWEIIPHEGKGRLRQTEEITEAMARIKNGLSIRLHPDELPWSDDGSGYVYLKLVLPTSEQVMFQLTKTNIMPPVLAAKYPQIRTFTGKSVNFTRTLVADVDYSPEGGLHALIRDGTRNEYYLDPYVLQTNEYKVYSGREMTQGAPWSCIVETPPEKDEDPSEGMYQHQHQHHHQHHHPKHQPEHQQEKTDDTVGGKVVFGAKMYRFKIAIMTNGQYSRYHGNTLSSVLSSIVTVMNRVNGIFKRDLGMFFELHERTDELICLHPCDTLPNDSSILGKMRGYINNRNIAPSTYDIAHSFTTGSGGVAYLRSMCGFWKAGGTTGLSSPTADVFYVDYVSHEIGHQINGQHSFSDCNGHFESPEDHASPVEPGSGSTIMGYAGICGNTNLQYNSDPIFHAKNAEEILTWVDEQAQGGCGTIIQSNEDPPIADVPSTCNLPTGNFFHIGFRDADPKLYYSIEPVDEATSKPSYSDTSKSKFRSWMPTHRPYRTFPNMYYVIHDAKRGLASNAKDEVIPYQSTKITFAATVRTLFATDLQENDDSDTKGFGIRTSNNIVTTFQKMRPLLISYEFADLELASGKIVTVKWDVGGTYSMDPMVRIMIARHDPAMDFVGSKVDYVNQVKELEWIQIAYTENDGNQQVRMPTLPGELGITKAHVMIRSSNNYCYFFDVASFIFYENKAEESDEPPSPSPTTLAPTTPSPTHSPKESEYEKAVKHCQNFRGRSCKREKICQWSKRKCLTTLKEEEEEAPKQDDADPDPEAIFCAQWLNRKSCNKLRHIKRPENPPWLDLTEEERNRWKERQKDRLDRIDPEESQRKKRCVWAQKACRPSA